MWDPLVRLAHWLLVLSVLAAWLTRHASGTVHDVIGYAALVVVVVRFAWGFGQSPYARLSQFLRSPADVRNHAHLVIRGTHPRYIGHNPLGGWMALALWLVVAAVCVTGWLYTTDRFWGVAWVGDLHAWLTNTLIALVVAHVAGVAWSSAHHRENLVSAMLHGRKRAPGPGDVD